MRVSSITRAAVIGAAAALALAACSAGASTTPSTSGSATSGGSAAPVDKPVTIAITAEPANLDYTRSAGAAIPQALLYNVYEGLVKLDSSGEIVPLLASSWTVSDDGLVYDFTLREGVTFSNGDPFTADTVKFSLDRVKTDWTANSPTYMDVVDSVEPVSDTEVKITLSHPSNSWLFNMAGPVGTMFTPNGVDDLEEKAIGTGPYTVASWQPGVSLELTANPTYWGEAPAVSDVTLAYYEDATAQTNALLAGDVDAVYGLGSPQLLAQFESNDAYTVQEGTTNGEVTLAMNNARAPFDNVLVRQAVMYAIDRQAVIDTAYSGYGTLIGAMVPPTDPWYDASLVDLYPYDPDKARELLAEAGVSDLTVAFAVPNLPYAASAAQVVQAQLAEVGITAEIESQEFPAVWLEKTFTNHDYDLSVIAHTEPRDVSAVAAPTYYLGYDNPDVMALFEAGDAATDEATYVADMKEATTTMAKDAAADWLFLLPMLVVSDSGLTGIPPNQVSLSLDLSGLAWS